MGDSSIPSPLIPALKCSGMDMAGFGGVRVLAHVSGEAKSRPDAGANFSQLDKHCHPGVPLGIRKPRSMFHFMFNASTLFVGEIQP